MDGKINISELKFFLFNFQRSNLSELTTLEIDVEGVIMCLNTLNHVITWKLKTMRRRKELFTGLQSSQSSQYYTIYIITSLKNISTFQNSCSY